MSRSPAPRHLRVQGGFTLIELLVVIVFGSLIVANVSQLVLTQQRQYLQQRQIVDLRTSLRTAASLLVSELRGPAGQDLYAIGANSVTVRSTTGTALICDQVPGADSTTAGYILWRDSGSFLATADDSAFVYSAGSDRLDDDSWKVVRTEAVQAGGSPPLACGWGNGATGAYSVEFSGDTAGISVGAPVRAFRRTQYGLFQAGGRWWFGRKVGSSSSWEELTGPFAAPADSGLVFHYYDDAGAVTATPADVASIEIVLTGETVQALWRDKAGGPRHVLSETFRTRVAPRG